MVVILSSLCGTVAIALAAVCGWLWIVERRDRASLVLGLLGVAAAGTGYIELGMMYSATAAEYAARQRWDHVPLFLGLISVVLFAHYYLGTGRVWLLWTIVFMRSSVLILNFVLDPGFNFISIDSLRHIPLLGGEISVIGTAVPRTQWQMFATVSLCLIIAYVIDAAVQRWRDGGPDSRRKALAVGLGIALPLLGNIVYSHLVAFGVVQAPLTNLLWSLGSLAVMVHELGRDVVVNRRVRAEVTELREHLAQAERVSALGQLASALAHELSQPLTATAANVGAARMHLKHDRPDLDELRAIIDDVDRDGRRAVDIITRMRQLSQRHPIEMHPLAVEDLIQDVFALVQAEAASKDVMVGLVMQPGLPLVLGDRVHLSQVLLNLLVNSIHAVEARPLGARGIVVEARAGGTKAEVELAVRDTGPGIPDSIVEDIFRPFFTTKTAGMGMGLALSREIIEAHGGRLWAENATRQEGAIFRFVLKRA